MVHKETSNKEEYHPRDTSGNEPGVRILLVGDPGCGKTSLIYSLIQDDFNHDLPPRLDTVTVPAEVTPDHVPIHITDYSERVSTFSENELSDLTRAADVICIVYVAGDEDSLIRVADYWIPTVRAHDKVRGSYRPIILVANKIDLFPDASLSEGIQTIRDIFVDVEAHLEVSALTQKNVAEFFYSAQRAITYPIAPLFDTKTRTLTKKCRDALTEIFKLSDLDRDNLLNDREMYRFQESCFGIPLKRESLEEIKQVIKQSTNGGIMNDAITLSGFLFFNQLSIDKGRRDFTWQVLRRYNYNDQLESSLSLKTSSSIMNATPDHVHNTLPVLATHDESTNYSTSEVASNPETQDDSDDYLSDDGSSSVKSRKGDGSKQLMSSFDFPWLRQNPIMLRAGVGLTVTSFISFIAFRYLNK